MRSILNYGFFCLIREATSLLRHILSRVIKNRRFERNPFFVENLYDEIRLDLLKNLDNLTFYEYVYCGTEARWSLLDNKICFGVVQTIRERHLNIISSFIYASEKHKIVELGSGDGSNVLYLAKTFKNREFIGLELSRKSVHLSDLAAKKFGIKNVSFKVIDLSKPETYKHYLNKDHAFYSSHCLEEMPRIFKIPLEALRTNGVEEIALLEPAFIFNFSRFFLDIARLFRIIHRDRLFGLTGYCKRSLSKTFQVKIMDLGTGLNPVNPTTLILLTRHKKFTL